MYPASQLTVRDVFERVNSHILDTHKLVQITRDRSEIQSISRREVLNLKKNMDSTLNYFTTALAKNDIDAYAQQLFGDNELNVGAEFVAMQTALTNLRDWVEANFPKSSGGQYIIKGVNPQTNQEEDLLFTTEETTQFRVLADVFLATVG